MIGGDDLQTVVSAAVRNDQRAWERLVAEFTPMIRGVACHHRLSSFDQDDVVQRTLMALVSHIGDVYEPLGIGAWLATTARRECLRVIRARAREFPSERVITRQPPHVDEYFPGDRERREAVRREAVRQAATSMSLRQRSLMSALSIEPALSYEQISQKLDIPVGSIGPSRQRCIQRMRMHPRISQLLDECVPLHRPTRPQPPAIDVT
jgi:RNA polymerase sigma factor (sigma-70 family)